MLAKSYLTMRLLLLLLAVGSTTAYPWRGHGMLKQKRHVPDLATYDDACNIGYCSVMGAYVAFLAAWYRTGSASDKPPGQLEAGAVTTLQSPTLTGLPAQFLASNPASSSSRAR